jgi:hypothetical protein
MLWTWTKCPVDQDYCEPRTVIISIRTLWCRMSFEEFKRAVDRFDQQFALSIVEKNLINDSIFLLPWLVNEDYELTNVNNTTKSLQPNWGLSRWSNSFWAWTTNQMRHLIEINRDFSCWLIAPCQFSELWYKKKKKKLSLRNWNFILKKIETIK